jgi:hypothetical protein
MFLPVQITDTYEYDLVGSPVEPILPAVSQT